MLAALLLGAALGLPVILGFVLYLGERSTGRALTTWFWADSRQQLSGLSLALMALLLALAVNVGVSTMVESFSRTFTGWLDGRLAADVYINASRQRAGRRDQGLAEASVPKSTLCCRAAEPKCSFAAGPLKFSASPITPLIAIAGRYCNQTPMPGTVCATATAP